MTAKDYRALAAMLDRANREAVADDAADTERTRTADTWGPRAATVRDVARRLCVVLGDDNARFNRARFLEAAGLEE